MAVALLFPDGTVLRGPSAEAVLRTWGGLQWTPTGDLDQIRVALSDRCWGWSATAVDPLLPPDEFLTAVQASGLCAVSWTADKAKPKVTRPRLRDRDPGRHPDPDDLE